MKREGSPRIYLVRVLWLSLCPRTANGVLVAVCGASWRDPWRTSQSPPCSACLGSTSGVFSVATLTFLSFRLGCLKDF